MPKQMGNRAGNESGERRASRRDVLRGSAIGAVASLVGCTSVAKLAPRSRLGFRPVPPSNSDTVFVPDDHDVAVFVRWGDPIGSALGSPAFLADASNSAADQALQFGMHHDGMAYFPFGNEAEGSEHGIIAVNHEYVDFGLLVTGAFDSKVAEHVQKAVNAHGVSLYEARRTNGRWSVVEHSPYARRITADTPIRIGGPALGHPLMQTQQDPEGTLVLGTLGNCANGQTPWGTYLTCEENFSGYFKRAIPEPRYGIGKSTYNADLSLAGGAFERFDLDKHPNEANRFGWVVEIDPLDPSWRPVKRTALGRFKHENAAVVVAPDGRVVVYMGDDEANEYVYKFVSSCRYDPLDRAANRDLLAEGRLYVAYFGARGRGAWREIAEPTDPGRAVILAREYADDVGGTRMDRPEWITVHPETNDVFCSLTNNVKRGATPADPPVDPANPRAVNLHGHIVRWREDGGDPTALAFGWRKFVLAGDPNATDSNKQGDMHGDEFSAPDGLSFDTLGRLWIQTDVSTKYLYHPVHNPAGADHRRFLNNQMLVADPDTQEVRRFLTGPVGCEITGWAMTPDRRTLFVNVQHPGEPIGSPTPPLNNDPADPRRYSNWPDDAPDGRPRSATLVITKKDGGEIAC